MAQFDSLTSRSDCLSADERRRVSGYRRSSDASAFVARRVFLREVLGAELGVGPRDIPLEIATSGKPGLPGERPEFWYSQSSTAGMTVVAVSRDGEVGIDVESTERSLDFDGLARRWFTRREVSRIKSCTSVSAMRREFMRTWTAREAAAKLTGEGMAHALPRHEVLVDPLRVTQLDGGPPMWVETRNESAHVLSVAWF